MDQRTTPALTQGDLIPDRYASPKNRDVEWLQARSSRGLGPGEVNDDGLAKIWDR
jgi:hypothetical protein